MLRRSKQHSGGDPVAVGNTVGLIEVMQSFTPIVAEQAGVRNPAAFPGAQLIRFEDATSAPCHAGSQVDSKENCNCCTGVSNIRFWRLNQASGNGRSGLAATSRPPETVWNISHLFAVADLISAVPTRKRPSGLDMTGLRTTQPHAPGVSRFSFAACWRSAPAGTRPLSSAC